MTSENNKQVVIIKPDGAQGGGFSALFKDQKQFQKFDEAVGQLPIKDRKKVEILKDTAHKVGVQIVDN